MPLSGIALCEAESITPRSASSSPVSQATPGVGSSPSSSTSTPAEARPGHDGGLEELPGDPGVAADDGHRSVALEGAGLGEDVRGGNGKVQGQLSGEITVGQTPDPVRAEKASHEGLTAC